MRILPILTVFASAWETGVSSVGMVQQKPVSVSIVGRKKAKKQKAVIDDSGLFGNSKGNGKNNDIEERGTHQCGGVRIPSIECSDGNCEEGFPRYERPCHFPTSDMGGKFKCRILCGAGYVVEDNAPKKIKCIGNKANGFRWKRTIKNNIVKCVPKM
ncbi:Oidioi.mRNA.OKI2018_I69.XSR.g15037.t1.cds [Oikopleura dioica]|uniref:Oidioi.mRNA.OKI2018_I69.XSR.g15037.t1.cds n=1 Tax=Oikopleura dioica TaxID=34765 RepID=A0ABN7SBJ8_OIKDI|nr:Oidioi.mRNA.OKI2018_I69.XSR.g15037.t1.cds [Oikopleura dioica]